MKAGGIVLCGGRSSRMGRPKAWLPFAGELLLPRVVRVLRAAVEPVVVVAAPDQDVPPLLDDISIVRDEIEGRGPLGGLAAGIAALAGSVDAVYLSSCDVPFLSAAFVRRVLALLGEASAAIPCVGGFRHPLAAAYRVSVLPKVREMLAANRLRLLDLSEIVPARLIAPEELADIDPELRCLRNVNTPEDYAAAMRNAP